MKGVYVLIINVKHNIGIKIGALGKINFKKGKYAYVGSSQNNLTKIIRRHLSKNKKKKWHIDYLLMNPHVKVESAHCKEAKKDEECKIAHMLSSVEEPVRGFGSSNCKCHSHLFRLKSIDHFIRHKFKEIGNIEIYGNRITEKCRK